MPASMGFVKRWVVLVLAGAALASVWCATGRERPAASAWTPLQWERIDIHTHLYENQPFIIPLFDSLNIRRAALLSYRGMDDPAERLEYEGRLVTVRDAHPDRFVFFPTIDVSRIDDADYAAQVLEHLDMNVGRGAKAIKIWKILGMRARDKSGKFTAIDDRRLDPIWERFVALKLPIIIHAAEPIDSWLPLDPKSPGYGYYKSNPEWHFYGRKADGVYSHAELMQQRDNLVERFPGLTVIANHFGSLEHDLPAMEARFARFPNLHSEIGARLRHVVRQPRAGVRAFFIKNQDRILYGSDFGTDPPFTADPEVNARRLKQNAKTYSDDFRYLETDEEVTFWDGASGKGLKLPPEVLRKIYWSNAKNLVPGI